MHKVFCLICFCLISIVVYTQENYYNTEVNYSFTPNVDSTLRITYSINSKDLSAYSINNKAQYYFEFTQIDDYTRKIIHQYPTQIYTAEIDLNSIFIIGILDYKYSIDTDNSLQISIYSKQKKLLNTYIFTNQKIKKNKENFIFYISNNENYTWNQPYLYCKDSFALSNNEFIPFDTVYSQLYVVNSTKKKAVPNSKQSYICTNGIIQFQGTSVGTYVFYSDSNLTKKLWQYVVVTKEFPRKNTVCDMLESLIIINPSIKIDSLSQTELGCKIELDKQWLLYCKQDKDIAKLCIKEYYNRINEVNKRFTDKVEGMYTDKGNCYILLGPPLQIETNNEIETWYYSSETNALEKKITFTLSKNKNYEFVHNETTDLYLEQARLNWRNGKIFTLKNN